MIPTLLRTLFLATSAGYRSMTPFAALSWAASSGRIELERRPYSLLSRPWLSNLLWLFALGELFVDKLPITPNRTDPGPLAGRIVIGAGVGATCFVAGKRSPWVGGLVGGAVTAAQTFSAANLRAQLNTRLPNPVSGSVEDIIPIVFALGAVASWRRRPLW